MGEKSNMRLVEKFRRTLESKHLDFQQEVIEIDKNIYIGCTKDSNEIMR